MKAGNNMKVLNLVKEQLKKRQEVMGFVSFLYTRILGRNRIRGKRNNKVCLKNCFLINCKIHIKGKNNLVYIQDLSVLKNCTIYIHGDDNKVLVGKGVSAVQGEIYVEDNHNLVQIGNKTHISGKTQLACIEGCKLIIGKRCLFSSEVNFRTGDSHSILDLQGRRINFSQDIYIGDHVWIGNRTIITKGARLAKDSVVATGAIVTNAFCAPNIIVGGIPAKVIKKEINWEEKRL